ncbi:MAG: PEGA domain-containing protein [Polyangiales bacterium]
MKRTASLLLCVALLGRGTIARAQQAAPPLSAAEELVRGAQLLEAMNAPAAIEPLERAANGGAGPLAWFNLGLAYRAVGRRRDALDAWDRYLRAPEPGAPPERLDAVRVEVASIERSLSTLTVRAVPPSIALFVDERPIPRAPDATSVSLRLDPGLHRVTARAEGFLPWSRELTLREAETRALEVSLERIAPVASPSGRLLTTLTPRAAPLADRPIVPWWTWVGVGAGALGTVTAIAAAIDGQVIYDRCRVDPARCATDEGAVQSALDLRSSVVVVGASLAVIGGAVVVAGVIVGRTHGGSASRARR